jgi:haloalkane dehalogenase
MTLSGFLNKTVSSLNNISLLLIGVFMNFLRTPDSRFDTLIDYPFQPHYMMIANDTLRMHYLDEGPRDGPVVLLMHGQPSWSYLYRHFVPALVAAGCRVLAPDLIGFGRSDKPTDAAAYTYEAHVAWMQDWLTKLDLTDTVLFCQDWGGLIGLRLVAANPQRFAGVVASNTALPVGTSVSPAFEMWLEFSQSVPELPIGDVLQNGSTRDLSDAEVAAYDAPFPDESYKVGARVFPTLVPVKAEQASVRENIAAWEVLARFDKPFITAFGDSDPITQGGEAIMQAKIPGAANQPHIIIAGGHHFIQEDAPETLVSVILKLRRP